MLDSSGTIRSVTRVVPGMTRVYRLDGQHAHFVTTFRYQNSIVRYNAAAVEQPPDVDGRIALGYNTADRSCASRVEGFLAKLERKDDWDDFVQVEG